MLLINYACVHAKSLHSCLTLCDPIDHSRPGSSVHGILLARILGWAAMLSSRASSWFKDLTHASYVSCSGRCVLYDLCYLGSPNQLYSNTKYEKIKRREIAAFRKQLLKLEKRYHCSSSNHNVWYGMRRPLILRLLQREKIWRNSVITQWEFVPVKSWMEWKMNELPSGCSQCLWRPLIMKEAVVGNDSTVKRRIKQYMGKLCSV